MPRIRATLYRLVPRSRRPRAILIGDEILAKVGAYRGRQRGDLGHRRGGHLCLVRYL
jgi:hypothetical protein